MRSIGNKSKLLAAVLPVLAVLSYPAKADQQFTASSGTLSGEADFQITDPSTLTITLFNTGNMFSDAPGSTSTNSVLTGLFFNYSGGTLVKTATDNVSLGPTNSFDPTTGATFDGFSPPSGDPPLGQTWAYRENGVQAPGATTNSQVGVSADSYALSGTTLFTQSDQFDTATDHLTDEDYGLVNGSDSDTRYIDNSVVITLHGSNLTNANFSNVFLKFGSSNSSETLLSASAATVPEMPFVQLGSLIALGGTGSLVGLRKRRKAKQAA